MDPCNRQYVYMSNGGHDKNSHGVALLYDRGNIEFRFLRKNGAEWRVSNDNLLPARWYHVTVSWSLQDGLSLYIDGNLADTDISPNVRSRTTINNRYNEFYLGRPNDDSPVTDECVMAIDGFDFWSQQKGPNEVQQQGKMAPNYIRLLFFLFYFLLILPLLIKYNFVSRNMIYLYCTLYLCLLSFSITSRSLYRTSPSPNQIMQIMWL